MKSSFSSKLTTGLGLVLLATTAVAQAPGDDVESINSLTVDDILWVDDVQNDKITSVQLLLGNSDDGYDFRFWNITNHDGLFRIDRSGNFIPPGLNRFSIAEDGNVGLSTTTAPKRLTIRTTAVGDGIRLINDNVSPGFETTWDFSVDAFAGLNIQDVETGNSVMRLREGAPTDSLVISPSGNVGIGVGLPDANLHVAGNGIIEGDVTLGSSRSIKHAIQPLDPSAILAAVRDLPLFRWRYKNDPAQVRHIGPMAEDVYAAFAVGRDDKHLSPADSVGVALAAVQGVDSQVTALRSTVDRLTAENHELRQRLAAIEQKLASE